MYSEEVRARIRKKRRKKVAKVLNDVLTIPKEALKIKPNFYFGDLRMYQEHTQKDLKPLPKSVKGSILAIDASYRYTGFAIREGYDGWSGVLLPFRVRNVTKRDGTTALSSDKLTKEPLSETAKWYYEQYTALLKQVQPELVIVEGMTKQRGDPEQMPTARAGLWLALRDYGHDKVCKIPPTTVKLLATGYGASSKEDMVAQVKILYNKDILLAPFADDQADSILMSSIAFHHELFSGVNFNNNY